MDGDRRESVKREARLDEVIAEYLVDAEAGRAPDREQLLARYPDLATDLIDFLDDRARIHALVGPPRMAPDSAAPACPECHAPLVRTSAGTTCVKCGRRLPQGLAGTDPFRGAQRIGRFQLPQWIGEGTFGRVYKCWDPEMQRVVAVKVLRTDTPTAAQSVNRFLREGKVVAQLDHVGIVRVFDSGNADGVPYLVSEFVPGPTLMALIRDNRPPPTEAAAIVAAVADALHHAHQKEVIHRDVKPSNIILKNDKVPVLMDFGLALWDVGEATMTQDGAILGTLAYMSPEQALGQTPVDGQSDVYSLGVVLYELLTGGKPFVGNVGGMLHQIEHDEPRPPRALDDHVPRDLDTICLKCLRKEPIRRYPSAADLAADLRRHLAGKPILARPIGSLERLFLWVRRNRVLAAVCAMAVVFLVATTSLAVAWAVHEDRQTDVIRRALDSSRKVTAETELDRGLAEAERGDVAAGMLWMARSQRTAPENTADLMWTIRVNQTAWRRHLVTMSDCTAPPQGRVLAFASDGRSAWFLDSDGQTLRCWDVASACTVGLVLLQPGPVESVAVSPDGREVACGSRVFGIRIMDTATGKLESSPNGPLAVRGMTYSPQSGMLLVAIEEKGRGNRPETTLRVWDGKELRRTGVVLRETDLVKTDAIAIAAGSDGRTLLAVGAVDRELRGWDTAAGQLRDRTIRLPHPIKAVALSPDGRRVLTGGDDRAARFWDIDSGQLLAVLHHGTPVSAVAFKDGQTLLTASVGDAIRVWHVPAEGEAAAQPLAGWGRAVAVSSDGNFVGTGADNAMVRIWNTTAGTWVPVGEPLRHQRPIRSIAFSPDGNVLATTTFVFDNLQGAGAQLWDVATGKPRAHLGHKTSVHRVAFSPDGRWAATAGEDNEVWVWDWRTGKPALPSPLIHEGVVRAVTFTADSQVLITAGRDRFVHCWDVATGVRLRTPLPHDDTVRVVAIHPSDPEVLLAAGDDGEARLWNIKTGALASRLPHGFAVTVAAFTSDGRTVLTGGQDGKIRVWDAATGGQVERSLGHGGSVRAVAVSRSGQWAATASEDGTARLWAIRTGRPIGPPVRHGLGAVCALIDPQDRWVVTAGKDGMARLQPAPAEATGSPEQNALWVQVATGAEVDSRGDLRPLDPAAWRQRRDDLQTFAAPPP